MIVEGIRVVSVEEDLVEDGFLTVNFSFNIIAALRRVGEPD